VDEAWTASFQDHRPQARLDRVLKNQVDFAPQQLLEEELGVHVGVECLGLQLDQEIDVAGVRSLSASH